MRTPSPPPRAVADPLPPAGADGQTHEPFEVGSIAGHGERIGVHLGLGVMDQEIQVDGQP